MNSNGITLWRCCRHQTFHCKAFVRTDAATIVGNANPEHTHNGNIATSLAPTKMLETIATPSSSQGAVAVNLDDHVLMALPKRQSLSRVLRRHRQIQRQVGRDALPPNPTDVNFSMPSNFTSFVLFDSGPGTDRLIIFGDKILLDGLGRATTWLADGTFKVVPDLFFQLYSIHFQFVGGSNPAAIYCLLPNKTRLTYQRVMELLKLLIPSAAPTTILTDFEVAAMQSFTAAYPNATVSGCYFHLSQSVLRKVQEFGLKSDYENDTEMRGSI